MRHVALDGVYQPLVGAGDVNSVRCDRNVIADVKTHLPEIGWSAWAYLAKKNSCIIHTSGLRGFTARGFNEVLIQIRDVVAVPK